MIKINIVWMIFGIVASSFYAWLFYMWLSSEISFRRWKKKRDSYKLTE